MTRNPATGQSGLAGHINPAVHLQPPRVPRPIGVAESKRRRGRGKSGEREVVKLYVAHGYPRAMRQPGSGALRDMGGLPILPGDIRGVDPWAPVEVKFAEASARPGRGWPGEAFVRVTLKKLASEHRTLPIGSPYMPVAWFRCNRSPWRVFVPTGVFLTALRYDAVADLADWIELTPDFYFSEVAHAFDAA